MYYTNGRLKTVLQDVKVLIDKSKALGDQDPQDSDAAIPKLTGGGIIALQRTVAKLQELLDKRTNSAAQ